MVGEPRARDRPDRAGVDRPDEGRQQGAGPEVAVRVVHGARDEVHRGAAEGDVARGHQEDQRPLAEAAVRRLHGAPTLPLAQEAEALPADLAAEEVAEIVARPRAQPRRQAHEDQRGLAGAGPEGGERDDHGLARHGREEAVERREGVDDQVDPPGIRDAQDPLLDLSAQRQQPLQGAAHTSSPSVPRPPDAVASGASGRVTGPCGAGPGMFSAARRPRTDRSRDRPRPGP